jgi:DNA (cytosine-5)-methyltransferase 1
MAFGWQNSSKQGSSCSDKITPTLDKSKTPAVMTKSAVRRLTPKECERLQGFPDDYTLVPHRNKPMSDGPRYKALGNSMAVPVMHWIGKRIQMVEDLKI